MPEILVTGGAGFIGTRLSRRLVSAGMTVHVADNLHPQVHGFGHYVPVDGVQFHPLDVRSPDGWRALLATVVPDVIVHLAAETGTGQSLTEATRHASVNVVGTTEMLDALTLCGQEPERIVVTSSRAVYGEGQWRTASGAVFSPATRTVEDLERGLWAPRAPSGEPAAWLPNRAGSTPPTPTNVYAATKLAQEHVLGAWCSAHTTALSVLRLQNVYGAGQAVGNPYTGVLTAFARIAQAGEVIPVYEDGEIVRDFVHVERVVDALLVEVERGPGTDLLADVGSGRSSLLIDVARAIALAAKAPEPKVTGQYRAGDVRAAGASALSPEHRSDAPVLDGLHELLDWARA